MNLEHVNGLLDGAKDSLIEAAKKKIGWEFDLTQFSSPEDWQAVVKALGVKGGKKTKLKVTLASGHSFERNIWLWTGPGLRVETNADPMTGEKAMGGHNEPGYASYIYLEGDVTKVKKAAALISKKAEYIKTDKRGEERQAREDRGR